MTDKETLTKVYEHTQKFCLDNKFTFKKGASFVYSGLIKNYQIPRPFAESKNVVEVVKNDTLVTALKLREEKLNPMVLNMASDFKPGGSVRNGMSAQEESLFRRTNYFLHLNNRTVRYPLDFSQVVYTSNVAVIKNEKNELLDRFEYFSFLACPGLRDPNLTKDWKLKAEDRNSLRQKIRMIFQTGAYHGHDSLVLGSLGCGVFHNPPKDVAEIFNKVIEEYRGVFKRITFAIFDDPNFSIFLENIKTN